MKTDDTALFYYCALLHHQSDIKANHDKML